MRRGVGIAILAAGCQGAAAPRATATAPTPPTSTTTAAPVATAATTRPAPAPSTMAPAELGEGVAPPAAADPLLARLDAIVRARSTRCVVARARGAMDLAQHVTRGGVPRAVIRIGLFAHASTPGLTDQEHWFAWEQAARYLADIGDLAGARLALAQADARAKPTYRNGPHLNQTRVLLGVPLVDEADAPLGLDAVPQLVRAGDRAHALELFAAIDPRRPGHRGRLPARELTRALVALDRTAELARLARGKDREFLADLYRTWVHEAMLQGRGVPEAVAALTAWRKTLAPSTIGVDLPLINELIAVGPLYGVAAELAALRRALAPSHAPGTSRHQPASELLLLMLYRLAILEGDHPEITRIARWLERARPRIKVHARVLPVVQTGSLDAALAAVTTLAGETATETAELRSHYASVLWTRHVAAGFEPGFDARLTAAICP